MLSESQTCPATSVWSHFLSVWKHIKCPHTGPRTCRAVATSVFTWQHHTECFLCTNSFNHQLWPLHKCLSVLYKIVNYKWGIIKHISRTLSSFMPGTLCMLNSSSPIPPPLTLVDCHSTLLPWVWVLQTPHMSAIMQYLSFYGWLTSLIIMSSRFTHVVTYDRISFTLCLNNILLQIFLRHD